MTPTNTEKKNNFLCPIHSKTGNLSIPIIQIINYNSLIINVTSLVSEYFNGAKLLQKKKTVNCTKL